VAASRSLFLQSVHAPRDWDDLEATANSIARARIFEGMAKAVGERGYANVTIGDVVKAASISRRTFYEHFRDKEDCFVETYRTGCENGVAQIDAALRALDTPDWHTRLETSLDAYVSILAAEPHFARVLLIEVLGGASSPYTSTTTAGCTRSRARRTPICPSCPTSSCAGWWAGSPSSSSSAYWKALPARPRSACATSRPRS
jgi:AcrR family transcriptional regulator